MPATPDPHSPPRHESEAERLDRNYSEMLQELRVAQAGVQILFAFLLTVPFSQRFTQLSTFQEWLYFAVMITVALATVMLVAPTAGHRILFRRQQKEFIVTLSNKLALLGLLLLAVAMTGAIALISDFIFGATTAVISTVVMGAAFSGFWFFGPIRRRQKLPPL
jgi:predicted neutral ceramidase superfamily lipid hydrolase